MALNPNQSGDSHNWNYSNPANPGFTLKLVGTIVAIQEVQAMKFGSAGTPTTPDFWDDGNPKMNIRMALCGPSGGFRTLTFQPAGKAAKEGKKKSLHLDLFALSDPDPALQDMMKLIGKTVEITTVAPPEGFGYGKGNPRPWSVVEAPVGTGPYTLSEPLPPQYLVPVLLANQTVSGGAVVTQPAAAPTVSTLTGAGVTTAPAPTPAPEEDIPF